MSHSNWERLDWVYCQACGARVIRGARCSTCPVLHVADQPPGSEAETERAAVVRYLRALYWYELADDVERGEHLKETP